MNTNKESTLFRKKPVVIEAVQIDKRMDLTSPPWWAEAVQQNRVILRGMGKFTRDLPMVEIETLEGTMTGVQGDWIIRGVKGELYPCKPDIFAATYEPVSAPTSHPIPTGATGERDWELACDQCNGSGHVFVKHQVAERKTDVQEFKEECECCEGRGFNIAFEDIPGIAEYVKSCRAAPAAGDTLDVSGIDWQLLYDTAILVRARFSYALDIAYSNCDATRAAIRRSHAAHSALMEMIEIAIAQQSQRKEA